MGATEGTKVKGIEWVLSHRLILITWEGPLGEEYAEEEVEGYYSSLEEAVRRAKEIYRNAEIICACEVETETGQRWLVQPTTPAT